MIKGLAIRQAFLLLDWLLVVFLLVGGAYAGMRLLGIGAPSAAVGGVAGGDPGGEGSVTPLAQVGPRPSYQPIITASLFGPAGTQEQKAADAPPPPPQEEIVETQLRLKLVGTSATTPKDLFATAVILNEEKNVLGTYAIGQAVIEEVTVEEIHARKVILFNKRQNRREVLRSDDKDEGGDLMAGAAPAGPITSGPTRQVSVTKTELVSEVLMNYPALVTEIKPRLFLDDTGKVAGITGDNLSQLPMADKLGVKDGDVLQSVNGEPIDSEQKVIELINKYRNASMVSIGLLRDGKPETVTYRLK